MYGVRIYIYSILPCIFCLESSAALVFLRFTETGMGISSKQFFKLISFERKLDLLLSK